MKFRNSLRDDAWLAARYAEVKRRLAARYSFDRDAYTNGKTGFIEAVLAMPPRGSKSVPMTRPQFGFTPPQPLGIASLKISCKGRAKPFFALFPSRCEANSQQQIRAWVLCSWRCGPSTHR